MKIIAWLCVLWLCGYQLSAATAGFRGGICATLCCTDDTQGFAKLICAQRPWDCFVFVNIRCSGTAIGHMDGESGAISDINGETCFSDEESGSNCIIDRTAVPEHVSGCTISDVALPDDICYTLFGSVSQCPTSCLTLLKVTQWHLFYGDCSCDARIIGGWRTNYRSGG